MVEIRMTSSRISFLIFMLTCIGIFCALGTWQIKRLHWKEGLIGAIDREYDHPVSPTPVEPKLIEALQTNQFIRGTFTGRIDFEKSFDLQGQIDNEKQSKHKMLPLEITKDLSVLIDMGPAFEMPKTGLNKTVKITGLLKNAPSPNKFTPDNFPNQNIWYSINPDQLKIEGLRKLVILPETTPWKNYVVRKPELRNAHQQYAIFWFTMATLIAGLTIYYLKRPVH